MGLPGVLITLAFAVYGLGAVYANWVFRESATGFFRCAVFLAASLVGLLFGGSCALGLVQIALHALVPSRLDADESALRVRVWNTWNGLFAGFRRTDAVVPREQVTGVVLLTGQGGDSQLFLQHASGLAFSTGWYGTKSEALRLGRFLSRWAATDSPVGSEWLDGVRANTVTYDALGAASPRP